MCPPFFVLACIAEFFVARRIRRKRRLAHTRCLCYCRRCRVLTANCSLLTAQNLTFQVTGHIRDMNPAIVVLGNQLREAYLPLALHLHDEAEQAAMIVAATRDEVGSTAQQVMAMLGAAHEGIELWASVARGDDDGLAPRFADGIKELVY